MKTIRLQSQTTNLIMRTLYQLQPLERQNLALLMKQIQLHQVGFNKMMSSGLGVYISGKALILLKSFLYAVYLDHKNEGNDIFNEQILEVHDYVKAKLQKFNYTSIKNVTKMKDEPLKRLDLVNQMVEHEYCQEKLKSFNETKRDIISYLTDHFDRMFNEDEINLKEDDYLILPGYSTVSLSLSIKHEKVFVDSNINQTYISNYDHGTQKVIFLATISLKHVHDKDRWNTMKTKIKQDLEEMRVKGHGCLLIVTEEPYHEKHAENAKIKLLHDLESEILMKDRKLFSCLFLDLRSKECAIEVRKSLDSMYLHLKTYHKYKL